MVQKEQGALPALTTLFLSVLSLPPTQEEAKMVQKEQDALPALTTLFLALSRLSPPHQEETKMVQKEQGP